MLEHPSSSSADSVCGVGTASVVLYAINSYVKSGLKIEISKTKFYTCIVTEGDGCYSDCMRTNFKLFCDVFNKVKNPEKIQKCNAP